MTGITLASNLTLPVEAATQTIAILAKRGVGKSTTARKLAEGFHEAACQFIFVDPVGSSWGLRSSADGQGPGLNVYIFGGEHGDLPLEEGAGVLLADVVLESGASVILDLSDLGEAAMRRFLTDFCRRLYERKARDRRPLHLVLDEADEFAPQRIPPAGAALFGAIDRIVRRGRARGLGVTLISQRPAVVNKDVLTQCEVLIAMRVVHPRDRKALEEWATERDGTERAKAFAASLTSLDIGEAWVWSPGWLDVFERVRIDMPWTYDSSYTPKPGETRIEPSAAVDVDLDALGKRMEATREQARATDLKALQARIRELEALVETLQAADYAALGTNARVVELEAEVGRLQHDGIALRVAVADAYGSAAVLAGTLRNLNDRYPVPGSRHEASINTPSTAEGDAQATRAHGSTRALHASGADTGAGVTAMGAPDTVATPARPPRSSDEGPVPLRAGARRMLAVLAGFAPRTLTRQQLATLSGIQKGGTFSQYVNALKALGYVGESGLGLVATREGSEAVGEQPTVRCTEDVVAIYAPRLRAGARRMLELLLEAHPAGMSRTAIAEAAGIQKGGTFSQYLNALKSNGLAEERSGDVFAGEALFIFEGGR